MTNKTIISLRIKLDPEKESETKSKPRGCRYPDARSIKLLFVSEFSLVDVAKKNYVLPKLLHLVHIFELGCVLKYLLEADSALTDEHRSLKFVMHEAGVAKRSIMSFRLNILEELANVLRQAIFTRSVLRSKLLYFRAT